MEREVTLSTQKDRMDLEPEFQGSRDMIKTTIRVDRYLWQLFLDMNEKAGLSSCFVYNNLIRGHVTGERVDIPKARPITLNMKVYYGVERPRRYPKPSPKEVHLWPPDCPQADEFWKETRQVGCLKIREIVALAKCWDCFCSKEEI